MIQDDPAEAGRYLSSVYFSSTIMSASMCRQDVKTER